MSKKFKVFYYIMSCIIVVLGITMVPLTILSFYYGIIMSGICFAVSFALCIVQFIALQWLKNTEILLNETEDILEDTKELIEDTKELLENIKRV